MENGLGLLTELLRSALDDWSTRAGLGRTRGETPAALAALLLPRIDAARGAACRVEPDGEAEKRLATEAGELARLLGEPLLDAKLVKQLFQACTLPEFSECRDSYATSHGRREPAVCASRLSGSHCVDCPLTLSLPEGRAQRDFLRAAWHGGPPEGDAHWGSFLPEPWRRLRVWVWQRRHAA